MDSVGRKHATRPPGRVFSAGATQSGYTVVELVVVILLLGILAANAMPRFFAASRFEEMGFTDAVLGAARYAHKVALASRCDTRVEVSATGYALWQRASGCTAGTFTRTVAQPGGGDWRGSTPAGIAVGSLDIYFDAQGRPRDTATDALYGSAQSVSVGTRTVTVEHTTGFAHSG